MPIEKFDDLDVRWSSSEDMGVLDTPVQSVITSPPYWDLKDYGHDNQIGKGDESYQKYLNRIENVLEGCYQNLRESGTIWLVADSFVQRGDTKLLPYHLTQKAQEVGFHLQNVIVWYKPTAIGGYNDRTVVNKKEYVLFLSKNIDYDLFIEQDEGSGLEDPANAAEERLNNVWRHPIKRGSLSKDNILHKAPYPVSLIERIVNISTEPGDRVLDPFFGSGTTALAALRKERKCIGYEINQEFEGEIEERLSELEQKTLPQSTDDD